MIEHDTQNGHIVIVARPLLWKYYRTSLDKTDNF
jgi:hypothetical protein